jgi:hypothetical protein
MSKKDKEKEVVVEKVQEVLLDGKVVGTAKFESVLPETKLKAVTVTESVAVVPSLTDEEKGHLKYLIEWAKEIGKKSNNVEFRRSSKAAITALSKYL